MSCLGGHESSHGCRASFVVDRRFDRMRGTFDSSAFSGKKCPRRRPPIPGQSRSSAFGLSRVRETTLEGVPCKGFMGQVMLLCRAGRRQACRDRRGRAESICSTTREQRLKNRRNRCDQFDFDQDYVGRKAFNVIVDRSKLFGIRSLRPSWCFKRGLFAATSIYAERSE